MRKSQRKIPLGLFPSTTVTREEAPLFSNFVSGMEMCSARIGTDQKFLCCCPADQSTECCLESDSEFVLAFTGLNNQSLVLKELMEFEDSPRRVQTHTHTHTDTELLSVTVKLCSWPVQSNLFLCLLVVKILVECPQLLSDHLQLCLFLLQLARLVLQQLLCCLQALLRGLHNLNIMSFRIVHSQHSKTIENVSRKQVHCVVKEM